MKEPKISVGILHAAKICFSLNSYYMFGTEELKGEYEVALNEGQILWRGKTYDELIFEPKKQMLPLVCMM